MKEHENGLMNGIRRKMWGVIVIVCRSERVDKVVFEKRKELKFEKEVRGRGV